MSRKLRIAGALLAGSLIGLPLAAPAMAADTQAPTTPTLLSADGYQCLEVDVAFTLATDDVTAQHSLTYRIYSDGALIGNSDDHSAGRPWIYAFAYTTAPGHSTITVTAVDAAGNESAPSNAIGITTYTC